MFMNKTLQKHGKGALYVRCDYVAIGSKYVSFETGIISTMPAQSVAQSAVINGRFARFNLRQFKLVPIRVTLTFDTYTTLLFPSARAQAQQWAIVVLKGR